MKEANANSEIDCFDFKTFQKENITFNKNTSHYEVGLPFKECHGFQVHHTMKLVYLLRNVTDFK